MAEHSAVTFRIIKPIPKNRIFPGTELFILKSTHGLPLYFSIILAMERKFFIEWKSYFVCAAREGWKISRAIGEAEEACVEAGYTFEKYIKPMFSEYVESV